MTKSVKLIQLLYKYSRKYFSENCSLLRLSDPYTIKQRLRALQLLEINLFIRELYTLHKLALMIVLLSLTSLTRYYITLKYSNISKVNSMLSENIFPCSFVVV